MEATRRAKRHSRGRAPVLEPPGKTPATLREHERRCGNHRLARHYVGRPHAEYGVLRERGKGQGPSRSQNGARSRKVSKPAT